VGIDFNWSGLVISMAAGVQRDTSEWGAGSEFTGDGLSISLMNQHPEYGIILIFLFKIVFTAPQLSMTHITLLTR
jgi:hypothetical protein